ncbi:hypothetical protein ODS41_11400 [Pyrobaculum sp. 3827-6]|uniref:hypothetical protein n=1 Tax=Pyrobaculum sp. 3827-6 TaxID=2983604 RepID=UPI0021DB435A|nr:hypothetical protein [Pyrobaculum sp. 3827-6]MCU7788516.1 hypothetical protein [Pyrobaculum sp. 3827-6]
MLSQLTPQSFSPLRALFKKGRFKEEYNAELYIGEDLLCHVKIFTGGALLRPVG